MPKINIEDYYRYNYHENLITILDDWLQSTTFNINHDGHRKILAHLHQSKYIKETIDEQLWAREKQSKNKNKNYQKKLTQITRYYEEDFGLAKLFSLPEEDFLNNFPFLKDEIEQSNSKKSAKSKGKVPDKAKNYIRFINLERIYLGVIRNFFTFLLKNSWCFDAIEKLNIFSALMAKYLYITRLSLNIYIMFTVKNNEVYFEKMDDYQRAYGFFKAYFRQFLNDMFWVIILGVTTFHLYVKNSQISNFFSKETTGVGLSFLIGFALIFDVWNTYQTVVELDNHWNEFKNELNDDELFESLEKHYQKIRKAKIADVYFMSCICSVTLISATLELGSYIAKCNPSDISSTITHLVPFLNLAFISLMFVAQFAYLTRELWDEEFIKLPIEEQNKIRYKAYAQASEEAMKIIILAIIIFVIASQIPFGGIPQMIVLALLTIAMIALVKNIRNYLESNMALETDPPTNQDELLHPAST